MTTTTEAQESTTPCVDASPTLGIVELEGPWDAPYSNASLSFTLNGDTDEYSLVELPPSTFTRSHANGTYLNMSSADLGVHTFRGESERGIASARLTRTPGHISAFVWHDSFPFSVHSQEGSECLAVQFYSEVIHGADDVASLDDVVAAATSMVENGSSPPGSQTAASIEVGTVCTSSSPCPFALTLHGDSYFCSEDDWEFYDPLRFAAVVGAEVSEAFKQTAADVEYHGMECPNYEPYGSTTDASDLLKAFADFWDNGPGTSVTSVRHLLTGRDITPGKGIARCGGLTGTYGLSENFPTPNWDAEVRKGVIKVTHEVGHNFDATHQVGVSSGCGENNAGRLIGMDVGCISNGILDREDIEWEVTDECWSVTARDVNLHQAPVFTNGANTSDSCGPVGSTHICNNVERIQAAATRKASAAFIQ